jgi:hypothetical protein
MAIPLIVLFRQKLMDNNIDITGFDIDICRDKESGTYRLTVERNEKFKTAWEAFKKEHLLDNPDLSDSGTKHCV